MDTITDNLQNNSSENVMPQAETINIFGMSDTEFEEKGKNFFQNSQEEQSNPAEENVKVEQENIQQVEQEPANSTENTQIPVQKEYTPEEFVHTVTQPFNINGQEIAITDPQDIAKLVQLGISNKEKVQQFQNKAGLVHTLTANGITTPEQIQLILDVMNGDPTAIAHLLQAKGVDTYNLPDLEETPYVPKSQIVTNKEAIFLDTVENIKAAPQGTELLTNLSNASVWDDTSLGELQNNPELMYRLLQDKNSGLFDEATKTIALDKTLGKVPKEWLERPYIELYDFVANELAKQSAITNNSASKGNQPIVQEQQQQQQQYQFQQQNQQMNIIGNNIQQPNQNNYINMQQKQAALPTGNTLSVQANNNNSIDFLGMTDTQFQEFEKQYPHLAF